MENILFKPYLIDYKAPVGALKVNEEVKINLYINSSYNIYRLKLVMLNDLEDVVLVNYLEFKDTFYKDITYNHYYTSFSLNDPYIYFYYFEFSDCYGEHFIIPNDLCDGVLSDSLTSKFQVNVYSKTSPSFNWYKGKVMYQIMVDRFHRSKDIHSLDMKYKTNFYLHLDFNEHVLNGPYNGEYHVDFFGGDLKGIEDKLDYLESLGVGVIYLNPIFLSPTSHKYNTSDYMMIDPMYGTIDDFISLITKAKEKKISIILDGVFNHTGDDSIYFNKYGRFSSLGAYQSKKSPYYSWYDFDEFPNKYRSWWGISTLPSVNQKSGFASFVTGENGVIDTWMKTGIKGFRLDVVDEICDDFTIKIHDAIRKVDSDAIVIGEVWEDASNKCAYGVRRKYFEGSELDSVMNYELKNGIIDYLRNDNLRSLVKVTRTLLNNYPKQNLDLMMNILSTHDTYRIITMLSKVDENSVSDKLNFKLDSDTLSHAIKKLFMAYTITYTMPGIPCIYYGDEVYMEGFRDPYSREAMKWDVTTPLQAYLKALAEIRKDNVFTDGVYHEVYFDNMHFVYEREKDDTKYTIIINNSAYPYTYHITGLNALTNRFIIKSITIDPYNSVIIKNKK